MNVRKSILKKVVLILFGIYMLTLWYVPFMAKVEERIIQFG